MLLHESPLSSRVLEPLGEELAAHGWTAIALDTPGYGQSEPLAVEEPSIGDYAAAVAEALEALGLDRVALYGANTGAQIAIELARTRPERLTCLVAEGAPILDDEERAEILESYCPPLEPVWDGSHLLATWTMRRAQAIFWPWFRRDREHRRDADMLPTEVLNEGVIDVLRAGAGYGRGYRAAFSYRPEEAVPQLTLPATICAPGGIFLAEHLERLPEVPANVRVEVLPAGRPAQLVRIRELLGEHRPEADAPPPPHAATIPGRITRDYARTPWGSVLVRRTADAEGRPLVMLHSSPGSGAGLEGLMRELGPGRPLYAFDTLGYGESDKPPWSDAEISDYADVVLAAAADLGLDEFDLYGTLTGGTIALETAIRAPERVRRLVLGSLSVFPDERLPELLERYAPPQKLRDDGAHLVYVWNQVKDLGAFWPWYDRTNPMNEWDAWPPAVVQGLVTEVLKAGRSYHIATQASFRYPKRERLPEVPTETLLTTSANRGLAAFTEEAASMMRNAQVVSVDGSPAAAIASFLDAQAGC